MSLLQSALEFLDAGISVIPAKMDGTKAPIGSWKQYQLTRPSREQVIEWFSGEATGIGIITGKVSGNLEMVELEGRAVAEGCLDEIREIAINSGLENLWNVISQGYVEQTPSGGLHWLWRIADEPVPGNTKLARRPGENDSVLVYAETRGEGGFVITAPSHGSVHPSGQPWQLLIGSPAAIPMLSWEERETILAIFRSIDRIPAKEEIVSQLATHNPSSNKPGDEYNAQANWRDILEPHGWKVVFTNGKVTYWRRPNKSEGISATTGRNDGDNLYVFSSSTVFEQERPYSKFAALALLEFQGDYSSTARYLRTQGYGATSAPSFPNLENIVQFPSQSTKELAAKLIEEEFTDSSWKPIDLHQFFDGSFVQPKTELLSRSDDVSLFYLGKVHSLYGESESGKSWVAQIAVAEQLKQFRKVVYIDFESDASDIINRLKLLKVTQAEILQNFTYIRPESEPSMIDPNWRSLVKENSARLVIIDGVTEALNLWKKETKDNDGITQWMRAFPRAIAIGSGAAVVTIDHVTKDSQTRGRFAIGGQAKLAAIDGSAYLVEPVEALAPGKTGTLTIRVTKDRPGFVRGHSGLYRKTDRTQEAAVITIDSTRAEEIKFLISPPMMEVELEKAMQEKLDKKILEFLADHPASTQRKVAQGVEGKNQVIVDRLKEMITFGWVENRGSEASSILYLTPEGKSKIGQVSALVIPING